MRSIFLVFRFEFGGHVQTWIKVDANNNSQHKNERKTSISFYASMNEIISPKHSNESKIKTNASVIFGGDNKGSAVKHKYNFRHVIRTFFGIELLFLFFFLHFRLIRNQKIKYVCTNVSMRIKTLANHKAQGVTD